MALSPFSGHFGVNLALPRRPLGASRPASVRLAHLPCMEPDQASRAPSDGVLRPTVFEPVLSLRELAAELHVSCQTLYDLRSQGRGPTGFRIGRCLRFRRSEIQAWLERLEQEDADRHPAEQTVRHATGHAAGQAAGAGR